MPEFAAAQPSRKVRGMWVLAFDGSTTRPTGHQFLRALQSMAIITFEDLMTAWTSLPTSRPSDSAECRVMIETTSAPPGHSRITSVFTAPGVIALTVPLSVLRALIFMRASLGRTGLRRWLTPKTTIGPNARHTFDVALEPTDALGSAMIEGGHEGLDIEQWSPIQHVDVFDVQGAAVNADQPHNRQSDGIWAPRRSRREDAVWAAVQKRRHSQPARRNQVQVIDQPEVREALDVGEPLEIVGEQLDPAGDAPRRDALDRHVRDVGIRGPHGSDRLKANVAHDLP